jgi:hypothetical protein
MGTRVHNPDALSVQGTFRGTPPRRYHVTRTGQVAPTQTCLGIFW